MDYNNKPDAYYSFPRNEMLKLLPKTAKRVLEVGCGQGTFAAQIKDSWKSDLENFQKIRAKYVIYED